ncbi:MAG: fimbrial protein [Pseudomonadota bacterium]
MTYAEDDEQPLDPAMERVRRKMIRLMVISIGIMMIGLLAVLFAIIYKIGSSSEDKQSSADSTSAAEQTSSQIELSSGETLVSSRVSGSRLILEIESAQSDRRFVFIDTQTGEVLHILQVR